MQNNGKIEAPLPVLNDSITPPKGKDINLADPSLSITYGTETMQDISRFADDLLSRVQAKSYGETGKALSDLMVKVKDIDVSSIGKEPGFLERLPIIGSLFNSVERTVNRFQSLTDQVGTISEHLEGTIVDLLRDIQIMEQLYKHNEKFYQDLTTYIEAGKVKLEEVRQTELPALQEQAKTSGSNLDAQKVRDFAEQINRFERRLHDLELSRTITVQSAPQIRLIQSNNQTLAEKIQTSVLATIPIWKSQMVIALSLQGQKKAAAMQKEVADTTNAMLSRNASLLQEASVATAKEVERSIVDIETLRDVHTKLIGTIEETLRITQEGREKRAAVEKELAGMESDLKDRLTSLAVRANDNSIEAASGQASIQAGETAEQKNLLPQTDSSGKAS